MDKSIFNKFDMIPSGHFHKKSDDGPYILFGYDPYQIYWNDDK